MRILLIEDDLMVGKGLSRTLVDAGMTVDWVRDGIAGDEALAVGGHALTLLDLGLGGMDGIQSSMRRAVAATRPDPGHHRAGRRRDPDRGPRSRRRRFPGQAVRAARAARADARGAAAARRAGEIGDRRPARSASTSTATRSAIAGTTLVLPAREFALIRALADRSGRILSRGQLEERLYGWGEEVESNAIDVLIHYVRRKFDKDIIRNVRGAGWMVPKGP